jgi:rhamnulose-1-phosphate aldolase
MVSVSDISAMQGFIRLCSDGWLQGWHERNGGNLSYRMAKREIEECESFFAPREWVKLGIQADNLKGECFIVTGAGRYIRNVALDPRNNICIVELNSKGDSYRIVWGLEEGGRPTSELESHILDHSVKKIATGGENRVMYHAHPANIVALSFILPHTAKDFSRALWKSMKECPAVFPRGVGVVPRVAAAGEKLARASYELMREFDAIVWAHHGMLCSGRGSK